MVLTLQRNLEISALTIGDCETITTENCEHKRFHLPISRERQEKRKRHFAVTVGQNFDVLHYGAVMYSKRGD